MTMTSRPSTDSATTGTINKNRIRALIPHAGAMCLLESVLSWNEENIVCHAFNHDIPDNPLRRRGRMGAACGIEFAAQAMALHGALTATDGQRQRAGVLASVRDTRCYVPFLDDGPLTIEARLLFSEGLRAIYGFSVSGSGNIQVEGRAAVILGSFATR